jgi:hypothetical protein
MGRGKVGKATLTSAKDRLGHYPRGEAVAEMTIDATVTPYGVTIQAPGDPSAWKPTVLMERVSDFLAGHPEGMGKRALRDAVSGKRDYIEKAIENLVADGSIEIEVEGQTHVHRLARRYTQPAEPRTPLLEAELIELPDPM